MIFRLTFRTITKINLYLIRNVHKPLGKSVSVPLGLRSAADTDAAM